jgi:hypothetical protein
LSQQIQLNLLSGGLEFAPALAELLGNLLLGLDLAVEIALQVQQLHLLQLLTPPAKSKKVPYKNAPFFEGYATPLLLIYVTNICKEDRIY